MESLIQVGDRVRVYFDEKFGEKEGWYEGQVFRIDPYSGHRSFYWVALDAGSYAVLGIREISVFNPKNIQKIGPGNDNES